MEEVEGYLEEFDREGNLAQVGDERLLELTELLEKAWSLCHQIITEHELNFPSTLWFFVTTLPAFGGLLLLEPTILSIFITVGGLAGAGKALFDRGHYFYYEQKLLGPFWGVKIRKDALQAEMTRRGIRF